MLIFFGIIGRLFNVIFKFIDHFKYCFIAEDEMELDRDVDKSSG